ncbi:hypothetical protein Tco_0172294, partial [Tanacetum coccineum]
QSQSSSLSWDELAVRVGSLTSNPSLPLASLHLSHWMGVRVFVYVELERVIGVMGRESSTVMVAGLKEKYGEEARVALVLWLSFHFISAEF